MSNARELAELGGSYGTGGFVGMKNRIINGAMTVSQYNGSSSVTLSTGVYFIDRYYTNFNPGFGHTGQQVTTVPTGNFTNSVKLTVGTGGTATAAQQARFVQSIEGFNMADFGWGTANYQPVTLSFWVRSSVTGTYAVGFANDANNWSYVATYTISAADTWQYVTLTIPGTSSGTWVTNNGRGVKVAWGLGAGSNYQTTAGSWQAGEYYSVSGAANWIGTSGATFYITGVQLEKGSTATSFDYRPYGTELALCQRYYYRMVEQVSDQMVAVGMVRNAASNQGLFQVNFPVEMRTNPTSLEQSGNVNDYAIAFGASGNICTSVPTFSYATKNFAFFSGYVGGLTNGNAVLFRLFTTSGYLAFPAEL